MSHFDFPVCRDSPLQDAPRLAAAFGIASLAFKRDDLLPFAGGGTKCRKLAGLVERLAQTPADALLLSGGATSNQVRIIAAVASQTKRACEVFLNAGPDSAAADFARLFGAVVHALPGADAWALNAAIRSRLKALTAEGRAPLVVPAASAADLPCYDEAIAEIVRADADVIVVAAGSGATSAGFLLGLDRDHAPACLERHRRRRRRHAAHHAATRRRGSFHRCRLRRAERGIAPCGRARGAERRSAFGTRVYWQGTGCAGVDHRRGRHRP